MGRPVIALALALGVVLAGPTLAGPTMAGVTPAAAATAGSAPAIDVLSQTPWVGPGQAMQIRLGFGSAPVSSLTLTATLYQCLTSRSAFALTVNGSAASPSVASATVPVSSLPADPAGGVVLTVPVDTGQGAGGGSGPLVADLGASATCRNGPGGVYPIKLTVSSGSGSKTSIFTYLVYAAPPSTTQRLRFAWVMPISLPPRPADAGGHQPAPAPSDVQALDALVAAVAGHGAVPLTFAPDGATVAALSESPRAHAHSALSELAALSDQPDHEVLAQSYVPVDATALVGADLQGELAVQVRRGAQALASLHAVGTTWSAQGPLDQASMAELQSLGYRRLVVPPSSVSSSGPAPALTPAQPFTLNAGHGTTMPAVTVDTQLSGHLAAAGGNDPALAAYQLLADLALIYYEEPNLDSARGVVAEPSPGVGAASPTFVTTVLSALAADPLVQPVTVDELMSTVPASTSGTHRPASTSGTATLPARQLRAARTKLDAFASAVSDAGVVRGLDSLLLSAEDAELKPAQQQQAVTGFGAAIAAQLSTLSIRTDTIRLTSTAAKIPITLVKAAPYAVAGTLRISGDKVVFPEGRAQDPGAVCRDAAVQVSAGRSTFTCSAAIGHATNAVYVDMRARATGDFRLSVTLTSPNGHLVLASSNVTVRSMSTSLVAIGLSLAAVAVLLAWWGRTAWRGRAKGGRGAHVRRTTRRGRGGREAPA
jgi:hypothetical protein